MTRETTVQEVYITERVNGWWVSVRYASGHEDHHGPYIDKEMAEREAEQLRAEQDERA